MAKSFKVIDDNNSGDLDVSEFTKAMRDYRITSDPFEIDAIIQIFDSDNSGRISYDEFIRTIVGEMNDFRKNLCKQAYKKMDANGDGTLDITDI